MDENGTSLIANWFRSQVVFVTGSTGFMGKVLVEKLLRDCPDIEKCYLLMRTKRGIEPEQRRDDYVNHMVSTAAAVRCNAKNTFTLGIFGKNSFFLFSRSSIAFVPQIRSSSRRSS